jgi:hypothetical protein
MRKYVVASAVVCARRNESPRTRQMDAERINLIGTNLADLQARSADLRGYL